MYKILIIEDTVDTAKVLRKRLIDYGFEVEVAYDAYSGTSSIYKEVPHLILLDLMLPAGAGIRVLKNLKLFSRPIPVVVLTAQKDEEYKKNVLDMGVDAYLEKPYDIEELVKVINKILNSGSR